MGGITTALLVLGSILSISADVREVRTLGQAKATSEQTLSCSSQQRVTSYRLVGEAGAQIAWGEQSYTIPDHGSLELMASRKISSYGTAEGQFALPEAGPTDAFGVLTIDTRWNVVLAPGGTTEPAKLASR